MRSFLDPRALLPALLLLALACDRPGADDPATSDAVPAPAAPDTSPPPVSPAAQPLPDEQLRAELERLLGGSASAAEPDTFESWFSAETAGALKSVRVDSAGHAVVDFIDLRSLIPNASSSAGSTLLLRELNQAVFRVAAVRSVEYRMEGSCDAFWEWLQYGCQTVTRDGAQREYQD